MWDVDGLMAYELPGMRYLFALPLSTDRDHLWKRDIGGFGNVEDGPPDGNGDNTQYSVAVS